MTDMDERELRSLFARDAGPEEDGFTVAVMARVERQRQAQRQLQRWTRALVVLGVLASAALLAPWVGRLTGDGYGLLAQALSQPVLQALFQPHQLSLLAISILGVLGAGLATWALRS